MHLLNQFVAFWRYLILIQGLIKEEINHRVFSLIFTWLTCWSFRLNHFCKIGCKWLPKFTPDCQILISGVRHLVFQNNLNINSPLKQRRKAGQDRRHLNRKMVGKKTQQCLGNTPSYKPKWTFLQNVMVIKTIIEQFNWCE